MGIRNPKAAEAGGDEEKDRHFVTALARGLQLLRCFKRGERWLGNQEFAQRSGLPKPTVSRLTYTLTRLGYLEYSPSLGKYSLGAGVLSLSYPYMSGLNVREVARPLMQELADYAKGAVSLGARDGLHMIYVEICQGGPMFQMRMDVGSRIPHGTTAMGRAYVAALPEKERREALERYREITPRKDWPRMKDGIEQSFRDYEKYGFCLSLGDWNPEVYAVGTPMVSPESGRILAFNCGGPVYGMTREKLVEDIGPRLCTLRDKVLAATGGHF